MKPSRLFQMQSNRDNMFTMLLKQIIFQFQLLLYTGILTSNIIPSEEFSAILQLFLIKLIRKNIGVSVFNVSAQERVYRDILCVMNECCNKNLSLNEIARRCAMSSSNLKKIFAKHNHIGIMKYFLLLRLKQAMFLLGQNMSVADVSEALSFPNPNYFSVVFKRELGCTPTQYVSEMQDPTRHSITRDT